jgi:hypothetical protein
MAVFYQCQESLLVPAPATLLAGVSKSVAATLVVTLVVTLAETVVPVALAATATVAVLVVPPRGLKQLTTRGVLVRRILVGQAQGQGQGQGQRARQTVRQYVRGRVAA